LLGALSARPSVRPISLDLFTLMLWESKNPEIRYVSPPILSHVSVIISGIWIGNRIYWTVKDSNYNAIANSRTLKYTTAHIKSSHLMYRHRLSPGNGFNAVAS
jgi:hypothetical protein